MKVNDLNSTEYNPYYGIYINKVSKQSTLVAGYEIGEKNVLEFFRTIPSAKLNYKYAHDKWTVKEVFQHIIDTERIFMYRCLRVARQDKTALAGFEQNDYIMPSKANSKSIESLLEEYKTTRQNSIVLLKSLEDEDLKCIGNASGNSLSARAAAFIILGHEIHHMSIIREHYL